MLKKNPQSFYTTDIFNYYPKLIYLFISINLKLTEPTTQPVVQGCEFIWNNPITLVTVNTRFLSSQLLTYCHAIYMAIKCKINNCLINSTKRQVKLLNYNRTLTTNTQTNQDANMHEHAYI